MTMSAKRDDGNAPINESSHSSSSSFGKQSASCESDERKASNKKYVSPTGKDVWKIVFSLMRAKKKHNGSDIVIAALFDGQSVEIVKSYFSAPHSGVHPLDTPIVNLILHACQDYDRRLFLVATCKPTIFERETINIMGIDKIFYPISDDKFAVLAQKRRKLEEKTFPMPKSAELLLEKEDDIAQLIDKTEKEKVHEKGQLKTRGSFLWCEDLKPVDSPQEVQNELYMGLLYSSLFILWNETARPVDHTGRFPVAAMLVDGANKPIAFSINTSKADNSMAHAETGMALRYFSTNKTDSLPPNSKLYTTLESCEMCRAGLFLAKDSKSEFKELYGKKDDKVTCQPFAGYSLSPYFPSSESLKGVDLKKGKEFFDFCRANYLAMKFFLDDEGLKLRFPQLFENIQMLWDQIIAMRMNPWVGNSVLYDLQNDPSDPTWVLVKQKPDFKELYKYYYGGNISEFIMEENEFHFKGKTQAKGSIKMGNFIDVSEGADITITITDSHFKANLPQVMRIPVDSIRKQLVRTGFSLDEKKPMGDYTPPVEDENLKGKLFSNLMHYTTLTSFTEEVFEMAQKWWSESDMMAYLTECHEKDAKWFEENLGIYSGVQLLTKLIWLRERGNHEKFRENIQLVFDKFDQPATYQELVKLIGYRVFPESAVVFKPAHPSSLAGLANVVKASRYSRSPGIGLHSSDFKSVDAASKRTAAPAKRL